MAENTLINFRLVIHRFRVVSYSWEGPETAHLGLHLAQILCRVVHGEVGLVSRQIRAAMLLLRRQ